MAILQFFSKDDFFEELDNPNNFLPGQFCWLPVPYIDLIPRILDVERGNPIDHDSVNFNIRNANRQDDFRKKDRILPLKRLNLKSNEELLIQRAKKRLGIILTANLDSFSEITVLLRQKGKKHLQEESLFVIPCYSLETRDNPSGFPSQMVSRIRCLLYRQFFYFPQHKGFGEGVARFDRIQTVIGRDPAAIGPMNIRFTDKVFGLFRAMFIFCATGSELEDLQVIREIAQDAYQAA